MSKISAKDLIANSCHYGQKSASWNPKMKPYLYGKKNNIHIFNVNKSVEKFTALLNRVEEISKDGKVILFVSTKPHTQDILKQLNEEVGMPIVSHKWFGGLLTNFSTIKDRILYMKRLQKDFSTGDIKRYTKKEQARFAKDLAKLEIALSGVSEMTRLPDAIFIGDGFINKTAAVEAKKLGIEVLGIADSNADPDLFDEFIPANDDAIKSLEFIFGHVVTAMLKNAKAAK